VKPTRSRKVPKTKPKGDLTPLLNMLAVEIADMMDLLVLVRGTDPRIDILCRIISTSLVHMEDIRERIATAVED
jgi:hypothetical protein